MTAAANDRQRHSREILSQLWRLAWPIAITGNLGSLAEALIIIWLGRLIGPGAQAVEATLRPVLMCTGWLFLAVASGVSVLVAQSVGARNGRGMELVQNGVGLVGAMWIAIIVIVLPVSGPLFDALASKSVGAADLRTFGLPAMLLAMPALGCLQVLLFAASGAGWTRLSLMRMMIDLCVTAALVPLFIHVLGFGLRGAPLGQAASQIAMIFVVWRTLVAHRDKWHLGMPAGRPGWFDRSRWPQILDIGLPPQVARIAMFVAYAWLVQRIAGGGRNDVVAWGVGLQLLFIAINFSGSMGRATGIALGQSVGAKDAERARHVLRTGLVAGVAIGSAMALLLFTLGPYLVQIFTSDPAIIERGTHAVRILGMAMPFLGISQVFLFAFTAVKASKRAGFMGIAAEVIGVGFVLAWPGKDQLVACTWSICVSNAARAALLLLLSRPVMAQVYARISTKSE